MAADSRNPIQAFVAERGSVSFREFMEVALYHPLHGYYGSGRAALGRGGDYFTNVSVGNVFGELLAGQFREMWERLGKPVGFTIVEQGANDGTFAHDVLSWCRENAPDFFAAMRYRIVEGLDVLRGRQRERLGEFGNTVGWRGTLEGLPRYKGVHFSNELVDAFPVHRVRFRGGEWRELYVTELIQRPGELGWREEPVRNAALLQELADAPRIEGYMTEVNLEARNWAKRVAAKIEQGWVLVIDYGFPRARYFAPERITGTLECYAGHMKGLDPLGRPGFCDLTAHVEFTSLAKAFLAAGMTLAGYTDQHHFLTGLVSRAFLERAPSAEEARGMRTLLHPEMLGRAFQVLGMGRRLPEGGVAGFRYARDGRGELGIFDF
jgi:SAM-dependent MidA family methyltransferase